ERDEMLQAHEKARALFPTLHDGKDSGPGAALSASAFPAAPKSVWERMADALDDPWWEDEMDRGDRLGPALVSARRAAQAAAYLQGERLSLDAGPAMIAERRAQAALVRCLFGNPFHPLPACGTWLTRELRALADGIYAECAFERMAQLADALEASGCTSAALVEHCRSDREHARGCWVVDLLRAPSSRRTLLAYSTVDGHTLSICERLKQTLEAEGHAVQLHEIGCGPAPDLDPFDTIAIGASIRYGRHRPAVYGFIEAHREVLDRRPSAFFSVNVVARKPGKDTPDTNPYLRAFRRRTTWSPTALAVFAGAIDYPRYGWVDRQVIRFILWLTGGPTDPANRTEFTDWPAVDRFAQQLARLRIESTAR
ncbi:MAG TPA: menaquinone-dependent protoporphyrinogen IX dehydrogenase, partial [Burkholderiales bacterium]|nr:menaquinone-dependent protoporphyrinogen IX dehydrogenase [Burkholderiales bacterium]